MDELDVKETLESTLDSSHKAQTSRDGASFLLQEYATAQTELGRCSHIFWTQAEFFLTLSTALLAFIAYMFSASEYWVSVGGSTFGLVVSFLWLVHGNRIGAYLRFTEARMREIESGNDALQLKLKVKQRESLDDKKRLHMLEKIPSSGVVKTALPIVVGALWCAILVSSVVLAVVTRQGN